MGQDAGCEAAIHAMRYLYSDSSTQGGLLVDAMNVFICLNRQVSLHNMQSVCPPLTNILINTYRKDIPLYIDGRHILSSEGTTQGDPLVMAMYSVSVTPLIASLQDPSVAQVWFADDVTAGVHCKACILGGLNFRILVLCLDTILMLPRHG